jgi:hypothetical protein
MPFPHSQHIRSYKHYTSRSAWLKPALLAAACCLACELAHRLKRHTCGCKTEWRLEPTVLSRGCIASVSMAYTLCHLVVALGLDSLDRQPWCLDNLLTSSSRPRHRIPAHHPRPPPIHDTTPRVTMRRASVRGIDHKHRWATISASPSMATAAREPTHRDDRRQLWATGALTLTQPQGVNVRPHQLILLFLVSACFPVTRPKTETWSTQESDPARLCRL